MILIHLFHLVNNYNKLWRIERDLKFTARITGQILSPKNDHLAVMTSNFPRSGG